MRVMQSEEATPQRWMMGYGTLPAVLVVALSLMCGCVGPADDAEDTATTEGAATVKEDEVIRRDVAATSHEILTLFLSAKKFSDVIKNTSDLRAFPDSDGTEMVSSETGSVITLTTERFYPLGKRGPAQWKLVAAVPKKVATDGSFTMTVDFDALDGIGFTAEGRLVWKFQDTRDGHGAWTETIKAGFNATWLIQWGHRQLMDGAALNMGTLAARARTQ
jgi:hypothetical protein